MAVKSSYGAAEQEICDLFTDYLEGDGGRPALVLGKHMPSPVVRNAVDKSLEAFGYGLDACTFAALLPKDSTAEGSDIMLDAQALFLLIEGLDPLYVIATDSAAISALGQAYRTDFALDAPIRVFGRSGAAFKSLDVLLQTPDGKQRAWKVLKSLQG